MSATFRARAIVTALVSSVCGCAPTSEAPVSPASDPPPGGRVVNTRSTSAASTTRPQPDAPASWQEACDEGDPDACLRLAEAYFHGEGVAKNLTRMARLEKRACELGSAKGCAWLGNTHVSGHPGFPRDLSRATGLWMQACEEGWPPACMSAARAYHEGVAVPADDKRAQGLLDQGCRLGASEQCGRADDVLDGPLSASAIRDVVTEGVDHVRACHDLALLADPSTHGRVTIRLAIAPDGTVVDADPIDNGTGDAELADCIATATEQLRFPAPGGDQNVTLTYPFVLAPRAPSRSSR